MTINDLTAEEQLKEIYDQMKGFRVTNVHRKKCTIRAIKLVRRQTYIMFASYASRFSGLDWKDTVEYVYWAEVAKLAEEL